MKRWVFFSKRKQYGWNKQSQDCTLCSRWIMAVLEHLTLNAISVQRKQFQLMHAAHCVWNFKWNFVSLVRLTIDVQVCLQCDLHQSRSLAFELEWLLLIVYAVLTNKSLMLNHLKSLPSPGVNRRIAASTLVASQIVERPRGQEFPLFLIVFWELTSISATPQSFSAATRYQHAATEQATRQCVALRRAALRCAAVVVRRSDP